MRSLLLSLIAMLSSITQFSYADDELDRRIEQGIQHHKQGHYQLAYDVLRSAYEQSKPGAQQGKAAGALGLTCAQMRRHSEAEPLLRKAYDSAENPTERAVFAVDLANFYFERKRTEEGRHYYNEALKLAPSDIPIALSVGLNLVRLDGTDKRLEQLKKLSLLLPEVSNLKDRTRFLLNLGLQAKASGKKGLRLAYRSFDEARALAGQIKDDRLAAEALDHLAQLYEEYGRIDEALHLSELGITPSQRTESHDLLIKLEWRRGRLLRRLGKLDLAVAAYKNSVDHVEAIRQDIPVEYQDGRSSFRDTLEPIYLGLADLLLQQSDTVGGKEQIDRFRSARNTVELIKQAELDDFLGDRCTIGSIRSNDGNEAIPAHTAVLYPIILPERLDLLVETANGIQRKTVPVGASELSEDTRLLASSLRAQMPYQALSRKLYGSLLRPLDDLFASEQIKTILVVPDGVLRLLPFGALHDGQRFAIEKYAIAVAPGLTITDIDTSKGTKRDFKVLLAGVSEPGAAVEKLPAYMMAQILPDYSQPVSEPEKKTTRSAFSRGLKINSMVVSPQEEDYKRLRERLGLPGVRDEIEALGKLVPGKALLNQDFSVDAFSKEVTSGEYRILHIASHGVFGGTADSTFIMAHDGLITIDKLQDFLRSEGISDRPIDLLTLSACETAEGDDRAPLGLSGAALKARAKSALGSLWPVSDDAAKTLMVQFYGSLFQPGMTKADALQKAQITLISDKNFRHPYFWVPFILVGNWL